MAVTPCAPYPCETLSKLLVALVIGFPGTLLLTNAPFALETKIEPPLLPLVEILAVIWSSEVLTAPPGSILLMTTT